VDYDEAKDRLTKLGCEFLTEDEFEARLREVGHNDSYFFPFGCTACGQAFSKNDFTDVLYAIYPTDPETGKVLVEYDEELGITLGDKLAYTNIGRCKFCGQCDIFAEL